MTTKASNFRCVLCPNLSRSDGTLGLMEVPATALREISVLKEIRHQNSACAGRLHDRALAHRCRPAQLWDSRTLFVSYSGNLYLVFELLDLDLKQYMDRGDKRDVGLEPREVRSFLYQLLLGIERLPRAPRRSPRYRGRGKAVEPLCVAQQRPSTPHHPFCSPTRFCHQPLRLVPECT